MFEGGRSGTRGIGEGHGGVGIGRPPLWGELGTVGGGSGLVFWGSDGPAGSTGNSTITDLRSGERDEQVGE